MALTETFPFLVEVRSSIGLIDSRCVTAKDHFSAADKGLNEFYKSQQGREIVQPFGVVVSQLSDPKRYKITHRLELS